MLQRIEYANLAILIFFFLKSILQLDDNLKVGSKLQHSDLPSYGCAKTATKNFNDMRAICTLLPKL